MHDKPQHHDESHEHCDHGCDHHHEHEAAMPRHVVKVGSNEPCPCGSLKKYKKCCYIL